MDEKLRFVIELQNKASAELRRMSKDFEGVKPSAGMKTTANWFQQLESVSGSTTKALRPMSGALSTIGVSSLAAGLSITGLISQFRDLAKAAPALQELSRQTGISRTEIERLKYAAKNMNVDPSQMEASLSRFSQMMVEFHQSTGAVYKEMTEHGAGGLAEKIKKESPVEAYKDIVHWLAAIPAAAQAAGRSQADAVQTQKHFAEESIGSDMLPMLGKGMEGFNAALAEAARNVAPITDELIAQSQKLNESLNHLDTTWDNIKREFGPTVVGGIAGAVDELRSVLEQVDRAHDRYAKDPGKVGEDAKQAGESIWDHFKKHWQEVGEGKTPLLPNPLDANSWHLPNPSGGLLDYSKPEDGPAPSGVMLPTLRKNFLDSLGSIPGDEYGTGARTPEAPMTLRVPVPPPTAFRVPDAYNREQRARRPDDLDGFVVGALDKPVTHLVGTLKTAPAALDGNVRPAAFHGAGFNGLSAGLDPGSVIEAAVKAGTLSAFREWAGMQDLDKGSGEGGVTLAAYHPGGGMPGGRSGAAAGNPALGGGSFGDPSKSLLDFIAKSEGGDYNVSWGNGRFLPGGHEQNLTGKTLNEILALGDEMRRQPGARNSSAMGRYQITGSTLRDLMGRMGLNGSEKYDEAMQDRLASKLISDEGPRALGRWEGLKRGDRMSTALGLLRSGQIASQPGVASLTPGPRGSYPDWMDPKSRRELAGINSPLARDLIAASAETGAHFRILQGLRSQDEANANARKGTGVRNSQHLYGAAADLKLTDANGHDLDRSDPAYDRYATAFEKISRAHGGGGRWLGHVPGWAWDRAHFDQGIGYGQSHQRDPYGAGGPTAADIAAGNREIFSGPDNPFLRAAKPLGDAADKLKAAVAPMPAVAPEPPRLDATAGQRAQIDPIELNIRHHPNGRTSIAAKHGEGVKISLRTGPQMVETA